MGNDSVIQRFERSLDICISSGQATVGRAGPVRDCGGCLVILLPPANPQAPPEIRGAISPPLTELPWRLCLSTAVGLIYRVNQIEIDVSGNRVRREGIDYVLRYQTFHVLLYLLEQGGKLVSKEELTAAIWSDAAVTDNALTQCIAEIRKALGDDSRHPSYIKTISKVGYQFVAPVETIEADQPPDIFRPEDQMHRWKQERLARTIETYIDDHEALKWQFDVVCVYIDLEGKKAQIEMLEDIILGEI